MLVPSFSLPTTCIQRVGDSQRIQPTAAALMTCYRLVFFSTFEELKLPIRWPMESAGVTKLYEPFPTPCLYVASAACMVGTLIPLLLAGNSTYPSSQVQPAQEVFLASGQL